MFDIGFSEILVCAGVALVVIGPERLPETVRTTGLWIGRIKRKLHDTREEIERQVGVEDIRRQLRHEEMLRSVEDAHKEIDSALNYDKHVDKKYHTEKDISVDGQQSLVSPAKAFLFAQDDHTTIETHTDVKKNEADHTVKA